MLLFRLHRLLVLVNETSPDLMKAVLDWVLVNGIVVRRFLEVVDQVFCRPFLDGAGLDSRLFQDSREHTLVEIAHIEADIPYRFLLFPLARHLGVSNELVEQDFHRGLDWLEEAFRLDFNCGDEVLIIGLEHSNAGVFDQFSLVIAKV